MKTIREHMTPQPHSIGPDIPLKTAIEQMRAHEVRHLPVRRGGRLIGILSDRDVKLAASFPHAAELTVEDVMTPDPYSVSPDTPLVDALAQMAEHKYGCTVICDAKNEVLGIFTAIDAVRLLSQVLR